MQPGVAGWLGTRSSRIICSKVPGWGTAVFKPNSSTTPVRSAWRNCRFDDSSSPLHRFGNDPWRAILPLHHSVGLRIVGDLFRRYIDDQLPPTKSVADICQLAHERAAMAFFDVRVWTFTTTHRLDEVVEMLVIREWAISVFYDYRLTVFGTAKDLPA